MRAGGGEREGGRDEETYKRLDRVLGHDLLLNNELCGGDCEERTRANVSGFRLRKEEERRRRRTELSEELGTVRRRSVALLKRVYNETQTQNICLR